MQARPLQSGAQSARGRPPGAGRPRWLAKPRCGRVITNNLLLCRGEHLELGGEGPPWRGKRTSAVAPTRSASSDRATSARSAQGGAFGVTPEMLVEPTELASMSRRYCYLRVLGSAGLGAVVGFGG